MKLDTSSLKSFYLDFKETLLDDKSNTFNFLLKHIGDRENYEKKLFAEHTVLAFMYEISFNNYELTAKIFKIVKVSPDYKNTSSKGFKFEADYPKSSHRDSIIKENSKVKRNSTNYVMSSSLIEKNKIYINTHIELNKYKQSLFNLNYPYQVKLFILSTLITLFFLLIIAVFELYFSLNNEGKLLDYFKMWNGNNIRNIYFSSIIIHFKSLLLIDNNIYSASIYNDINSYRNLIVDKMTIDINKTVEFNNNLTFYFNNIDNNIMQLYTNHSIMTYNLLSNLTVYNEYESLSNLYNNIILKIFNLIKGNLKFNNTNEIFYNSPYFNDRPASNLLREIYFIIENYYRVIRYYSENLGFLLDNLLSRNSFFFSTRERDILIYMSFVVCFIALFIFYVLISKVTSYKIRILTVFFLIDQKWADLIIKRCRKYLEDSENFLKKDTKKNSSMNFFEENDEKFFFNEDDSDNTRRGLINKVGNETEKNTNNNHSTSNFENKSHTRSELIVKRDKKSIVKKRGKIFTFKRGNTVLQQFNSKDKNEKKKYEPVEGEETEKNIDSKPKFQKIKDLELLKSSISQLEKTRWVIFLKIILLLLIVCVYFSVTIILNYQFTNDILENSIFLKYIGNRGWGFNNLLIFYKLMLITGKKNSQYNYVELDYLYNNNNLDSIDLFNLYFKECNENEQKIQDMNSNESPLLKGFNEIERTLNKATFCNILKEFDTNYYIKFASNCTASNQSQSSFGLANSIGYINNFLYNNYYSLKGENMTINILPLSLMIKYLTNENLAINIDNSIFLINQAFISQLSNHFENMNNYISFTISSVITRNSIFLFILILELIFFLILSNSLKNMINEDKAILTIIPSLAISKNERIIQAFNDLRNIS